jgi:hypothetical protein
MDWKEYEREIEKHFRAEYPSASITADAKIEGKFSAVTRQIDLLIEENVCDSTIRIVVDAKWRNHKLDVKEVEEFLGLAKDASAHKAILIAPEGYTEAALKRAQMDDADLLLDVLNFKELKKYQGLGAIPYSGGNGAVVQPPLGWVVDCTQGHGALAWLYERGLTLEQAMMRREFMYVNFWTLNEGAMDITSLWKYQEGYLRSGPKKIDKLEQLVSPHRKDTETALRKVSFKEHHEMAEFTGFVKFDKFIFMCVLFTPKVLEERNLAKLRFVMRKVISMKVVHEVSSKSIVG